MNCFVTFDLNGWLDHLVDENGRLRTLGLRSCLYRHEGRWLLGAQALAAARYAGTDAPLLDATAALASAAGHGSCPSADRKALPDALWQLVADATRTTNGPVHLALVIPDGQYLGTPKIRKDTGKTPLETLHDSFLDARPTTLAGSRVEFVWRSVAALKAVQDQGLLGNKPGAIFVISATRRIFWTILELRTWPPSSESQDSLHIVRKPVMNECEENEAWTTQRLNAARKKLNDDSIVSPKEIYHWTRWAEICATGVAPKSLAKLGIDANAIEHRSVPTPSGEWTFGPDVPSIHRNEDSVSLPPALEKQIQRFLNHNEEDPLAIIIEDAAGAEITLDLEPMLQRYTATPLICHTTGAQMVRAAAQLACCLSQDQEAPAWLDAVPGIELEVRTGETSDGDDIESKWLTVVSETEMIPAGKTYHSHPNESRRVTLAPGVEHVHLHLRRGKKGQWDERYSGAHTGHTIRPSDRLRFVEPLARVRPLSGEARIEIVEHFPNRKPEALAGSKTSIQWSDMSNEPPSALRGIPELYIFKASSEGWKDLEPLLREVMNTTEEKITSDIRDKLYKCTQKQWKDRIFPLGSDGQPPITYESRHDTSAHALLRNSTDKLLRCLDNFIHDCQPLRPPQTNRMHLPLTWLFTGCPEQVVEHLLKAILEPEGPTGRILHMDNEFSAWSIYSGVGRTARSAETLRTIFDTLIQDWKHKEDFRQNKFLLAIVSHPMARRVIVRKILNEDRERFERVKNFLKKQLENLLEGKHDPRPQSTKKSSVNPSLELRYITMGFRGLCQVRYTNPDWFPDNNEETNDIYSKLRQASKLGKNFERDLVKRTAPYLIGEGKNPAMPGGF